MSFQDVLFSIDSEISRLQQIRALLTETGARKRGRKPSKTKPAKAKRTFSAAALKRIAAAQRKRWAAVRKASRVSS